MTHHPDGSCLLLLPPCPAACHQRGSPCPVCVVIGKETKQQISPSLPITSLTHSLTHSTHSLTHSLTILVTHSAYDHAALGIINHILLPTFCTLQFCRIKVFSLRRHHSCFQSFGLISTTHAHTHTFIITNKKCIACAISTSSDVAPDPSAAISTLVRPGNKTNRIQHTCTHMQHTMHRTQSQTQAQAQIIQLWSSDLNFSKTPQPPGSMLIHLEDTI